MLDPAQAASPYLDPVFRVPAEQERGRACQSARWRQRKRDFGIFALAYLVVAALLSSTGACLPDPVRPIVPRERAYVLFERDNGAGGVDLWQGTLEGDEPAINRTRFSTERFTDFVIDDYRNRIWFVAAVAGTTAFYSTSVSGSDPVARLTTEDLGVFGRDDWQVIGSERIVVKTTRNNEDLLLSIPLDGSAIDTLAAFPAGTIRWPRDPGSGRNLVAAGRYVIFEFVDDDESVVLSVEFDGGSPVALGTGPRSRVAIDVFGQPLIDVNGSEPFGVIIEESSPTLDSKRFSLWEPSGSAAPRPLSPSLVSGQQPALVQVCYGHFVYAVDDSSAGRQDLFATNLAGGVVGTSLTAALPAAGLQVRRVAWNRLGSRILFVTEVPGALPGSVFADVYQFDLANFASPLPLTVPGGPPATTGDIAELFPLDQFVVFARASVPGVVLQANTAQAGSETPALTPAPSDQVSIARAIARSPFQGATSPPLAAVVLAVRTSIGGQTFTNFFSLTDAQGPLAITRMTNNFTVAEGAEPVSVLQTKSDRIVYRRDGVYTAMLGGSDSEQQVSTGADDSLATLDSEDPWESAYLFYRRGGDLYSARIDLPANDPASTRRITAVVAGETAEPLFAAEGYLVLEVRGNGRSAIFSSPVAPTRVQLAAVSGGSADRFRGAFRIRYPI